jgi:D-glycero-D-manno-heptose 1,7-bisphosphate phosphatase
MTDPQPTIRWTSDIPKLINKSAKNSKIVIGLDRDGTINKDLGTYVTKPEDFDPIPGSLEAITTLKKYQYQVVIISNQGGIEKCIKSQSDVALVNQRMFELLGKAGCMSIEALYYSESNRKDDMYAKPNTGMFKRCEKEHPDIKFSTGYYVGDKISDLKVAMKMDATPILVRTGYGEETEKLLNRFTYKKIKAKTKIFDDLSAFVKSLEM